MITLIKKTVFSLRLVSTTGQQMDVDLSEMDQHTLLDALVQDWRVMALMGRKLPAVKLVRSMAGFGLREARDVVERYMKEHHNEMSAENAAHSLASAIRGEEAKKGGGYWGDEPNEPNEPNYDNEQDLLGSDD